MFPADWCFRPSHFQRLLSSKSWFCSLFICIIFLYLSVILLIHSIIALKDHFSTYSEVTLLIYRENKHDCFFIDVNQSTIKEDKYIYKNHILCKKMSLYFVKYIFSVEKATLFPCPLSILDSSLTCKAQILGIKGYVTAYHFDTPHERKIICNLRIHCHRLSWKIPCLI